MFIKIPYCLFDIKQFKIIKLIDNKVIRDEEEITEYIILGVSDTAQYDLFRSTDKDVCDNILVLIEAQLKV